MKPQSLYIRYYIIYLLKYTFEFNKKGATPFYKALVVVLLFVPLAPRVLQHPKSTTWLASKRVTPLHFFFFLYTCIL
jgi:hypothetical protein